MIKKFTEFKRLKKIFIHHNFLYKLVSFINKIKNTNLIYQANLKKKVDSYNIRLNRTSEKIEDRLKKNIQLPSLKPIIVAKCL